MRKELMEMKQMRMNYLTNTATFKNGKLIDTIGDMKKTGRTILKKGHVVDPKNDVDSIKDVAVIGDTVVEVADEIKAEKGDIIVDCSNLLVVPGLIDMHLHLHDLFEVSSDPIIRGVADGVTMGLSPGAGNTFIAPGLIGAEVDRGVPMNVGVYLGASNVLSTMATTEDLIAFFKGELDPDIAFTKITRNAFSNSTGQLCVGIKDHMGHFLLSDEHLDAVYRICTEAKMMFMSHTQDPNRAEHVVAMGKGRQVHLGHADFAGCGTHGDPVESIQTILELIKKPGVTAEFVTSQLRPGRGSRECMYVPEAAQKIALEALNQGKVKILISDGANDATLKGAGDTRDDVPCIVELADQGILSLKDSVATMTWNVARHFGDVTGRTEFWHEKIGHLGVGAYANITCIDRLDKLATYTFVNGRIAGFENRTVRRAYDAGRLVTTYGMIANTGIGDLAMFAYGK
ncbi:MAG: amidohydrolase family protein [Acidaminococcales bacterium]|nr:amidohydrolase family protein [Acidaminococcales bacterium]